MKLSARNQFKGKIVSMVPGPVNAEVEIEIAPGIIISAIITRKSAENLKLKNGSEAYAVIKASNVMIGVN